MQQNIEHADRLLQLLISKERKQEQPQLEENNKGDYEINLTAIFNHYKPIAVESLKEFVEDTKTFFIAESHFKEIVHQFDTYCTLSNTTFSLTNAIVDFNYRGEELLKRINLIGYKETFDKAIYSMCICESIRELITSGKAEAKFNDWVFISQKDGVRIKDSSDAYSLLTTCFLNGEE